MNQEAPCHFWSAWADVLLGDRGQALSMLMSAGLRDGVHRRRAFHLACQATTTAAGHDILCRLADQPVQLRWLIEGCGVVGDPVYAPWLIKHMPEPLTARLAGQAFSMICGVNLAANRLDQPAPENLDTGPNDNPDDPNVEMDDDDGLPWPDPKKIEAWWAANGGRFQKGSRYFMGAPVTREHCIEVLKTGYQRQRILAAHYLCLLEPGTPLFNTSAPAWRQRRWLAKM